MDCPQCKGYRLEPKELEPGLVAARCGNCEGTLLSLLNYRFWVDHHHQPAEETDSDTETIAHGSEQAHLCPKCNRLMSKFSIGVETSNRLDLCAHCDEAWLDKGEWRLLKHLDLQGQLPKIFTDAWQTNIRSQRQEHMQRERYVKQLGEADFDKLHQFKQWMNAHPKKEQIKQYLLYYKQML